MKKSILALVIMVSFAKIVNADTIILGEYKGVGSLNVSEVQDSRTSSYVNSCKMAYNINYDPQYLNIDFGIIECEHGLDTWNDITVALTISGNQLLRDGKVVGTIEPDGTAVFTVSSFQIKSYKVMHYDSNCQMLNFETKNFKVGHSLTFRIKKNSDSSFQLTRFEDSLKVANTYKKEWNNCPSITDYTSVTRKSDFDVNLVK